jgi:pyridoxamine 5'-phosphate oxidase
MNLADLRKDYSLAGLTEKDLARDPFRQFEKWFAEAQAAKIAEPNAMVLATASRDARPSSRVVLLKGLDGRGFVFYSNYESHKGRDLEGNPRASLCFPWVGMERQVIVEGAVARVTREESDAYFHTRPRASQLGAWVSAQSSIIPDRRVLEDNMKALEQKYAGAQVPLPPNWGGWRLTPETVEFWQGRRKKDGWTIERLSP